MPRAKRAGMVRAMIFLSLIAALAVATFIHLAGMIAAARIMRVGVDIVSYGGGPTLAIKDVGEVTYRLALFPGFSQIRFVESGYEQGRVFDELPRLTQAAIALSGCAAGLIVAALILGPIAAIREVASSWPEFFSVLGQTFPFSAVQWASIAETARNENFLTLLALTCAKYAGLNLLPLAPFKGGMALAILLGWRSQAAFDTPLFGLYLKSSLLIVGVLTVLWLIGGISYAGWGV